MVKVARIAGGAVFVAPFGVAAGALPLLDGSLSAHQEAVVARAGATLVDVPDVAAGADADAAFDAATYFDDHALQQVLSAPGAGHLVAAPASALFAAVQRTAAGARGEGPLLWRGAERGRQGARWGLEGGETASFRTGPRGAPPARLSLARGPGIALPVHSWVDYLDAGLMHLCATLAPLSRSRIHKSARIARGAFVERSIIGPDARIDAGASVVDSYIGPGALVAPHSVFHTCVVGEGCSTLIDSHFRRCLFFPGSTLSNVLLEDSVMGESSFLTTAASVYDQEPGQNAKHDGQRLLRPTLGVAIGHHVTLGARALMESGVAIPSGSVVVMRPDEGITKLTDAGLKAAHTVRASRNDAV